MPDKAPLEQDSDQYEEDRKAYDELQDEKTRYLNNQQKRVGKVLDDRKDRGDRVHGSFAPFIVAKSREDAEALTGRRALVARFTDLTKYIGDTDEDFEITQELVAGFRQMQMPIAQSSKGSLNIDDTKEAIGTFNAQTAAPLTPIWFLVGGRWCQIVSVDVPPVGGITRIEVIQTAAMMPGSDANIYISERGFTNTIVGINGLLTDYDNRTFFAGAFAVVAAGVVYDRLTPPDIPYINHDDEPSGIAGALPQNAGYKNGKLWVLLAVLTPVPPANPLRVKITTKEAI